jgi:colicin import membrane protein
MRRGHIVAGLWLAGLLSLAHGQTAPAEERRRIAQEREQVLAEHARREYECSQRFAVTACVDAAKADRRSRVDALRRQEEVLDSDERRRRAAARLESIRQKTEADARLRPPGAAVVPVDAAPAASAPRAAPHALPAQPSPPPPRADRADERPPAAKPAVPRDRPAAAPRAADRAAAAERARTTRQRQEAAAEADRARKQAPAPTRTPAASLPPRPPIPGASSP